MISQKKFLEIFEEEPGFSKDELIQFYRRVRKVVILRSVGEKGQPLLIRLFERYHWPILARMDDPKMRIYKEADDLHLLGAFIRIIKEQKENNTWVMLRQTAMKMAGLCETIFGFSSDEIERCEKIGKKYEERMIKARQRRLKLAWGALGAGAAVAGVVGAGVYVWKKSKGKGKNGLGSPAK